jgi:predicted dehydrogenase
MLHSRTLAALDEFELVAVVARREESLAAALPLLPGVPGYLDLEKALAETSPEAWVVACSTAQHVSVTRRLLRSGARVLLEKPIAETLAEARELSDLVEPGSSRLMLGHIVLFNSEFAELLPLVQHRGQLAYLQAVRHRPATIVRQFPGENPLVAAMVHDLYCVQALVAQESNVGRSPHGAAPTATAGPAPDPVCYSAAYHRTPEGEIDLASARLVFPGGLVADFTASYLTPAGMAPRGYDRLELFGAGWSARCEPNPRPLQIWGDKAEWPLALEIRAGGGMAGAAPTGMLAEELRCFARVVRDRQPIPRGATFHDGLQVQAWIERLHTVALASP